jgi:hypothetical protein
MPEPRALPTRAAGCPTRDRLERALRVLSALPVDEPSPAPRFRLQVVPDLPLDDGVVVVMLGELGDAA